MQEATLRFLLSVIRSDADRVCLYSDQNMDWMLSDSTYLMKWAALMGECVKKGVRICIIHNIDRNLGEMVEAIGMWLPLYMSGMIEPYFCKKPKDPRFSHSLFLCKEHFCIEANHVIGTEAEGISYYRNDREHLKLAAYAFEKLLESSQTLIRFIPAGEHIPSSVKINEKEFKNIGFCIEDDSVMIEHFSNPALIFKFTQSNMVRAFKAYAAHRINRRD